MANDKKISQLGTRAAGALLDSDQVHIYAPAEAAVADQNKRATLPALKSYLGILKDNLVAIAAPGVSDDGTAGYAVGSRWMDVTADKAYVCLDVTTGAAVWRETSALPGTEPPKAKTDGAGAPAGTNDNTQGYEIGSHWMWPASKRIWVCVDATTNVAVWVEVSPLDSGEPTNNWTAVAAPGATDDSDSGYSTGSQWLWAAQGKQWACKVATVGAATWEELTDAAATILNKWDATLAPGAGDDSADGYEPGSRWLAPATNQLWVCEVATLGAAVWLEIAMVDNLVPAAKNNMVAVAAPVATNDAGSGYSKGSVWMWGNRVWICKDETATAAKWVEYAVSYLPYRVYNSGVDANTVSISVLGRVPDDTYLIDCRPCFHAEGVASPNAWTVDLKVGGVTVISGMSSSNLSAWGVADLGKTIVDNNIDAGDAVGIVVTTTAGQWRGLQLWLKVAQRV